MAQNISIGEMRTRITVKTAQRVIDADGFETVSETDVFPAPVRCKWVWQHGTEVMEHMRLGLGQTATLTMYYTPLIDVRCRIWHDDETGDANAWEVVSINVIEDRRKLMEISVRRDVKA